MSRITRGKRMVPKKEERPAPKPKKTPKPQEEKQEYDYKVGYYYNGTYYGPPRPLRLVPYLPWRKAWTGKDAPPNENVEEDEDEDEDAPPRLDGKTKSLIKRLNKSPNSIFSKERTVSRNKSRLQSRVQYISC